MYFFLPGGMELHPVIEWIFLKQRFQLKNFYQYLKGPLHRQILKEKPVLTMVHHGNDNFPACGCYVRLVRLYDLHEPKQS